jgi:glycosyltransferase involved in cell wall biosynthesis
MGLTVLSVAYPLAAVGPDAVGGAEQVLTSLDEALVDAGHRSLVIACEGSATRGRLLATPPVRHPFDEEAMQFARHRHRVAIRRAVAAWDVDVVHMHGLDFDQYLPPEGVPVLATIHLPPSWYPLSVFHLRRPATRLHCVSEAQRLACPPCAAMLPAIENGVRVPPVNETAQRIFALTIGRICPEKGFHHALDAADRAGVPLVLAGHVFPYEAHEAYFREEIAPRLHDPHRFAGPAGRAQKERLYAEAICVLIPSLVPETSSLVALEAMAAGTPVIAYAQGALPEIVQHGRTGFLVRDVDGMAQAIRRAGEIDPEECRRAVRERYSIERMVSRYFEVYRQCCMWNNRAVSSRSAGSG